MDRIYRFAVRMLIKHSSDSPEHMVHVNDSLYKCMGELADKVPNAPTTDGTYNLQVTIASGTQTFSWVANAYTKNNIALILLRRNQLTWCNNIIIQQQ